MTKPLDTSLHWRRHEERMREDPEYRKTYLRIKAGLSVPEPWPAPDRYRPRWWHDLPGFPWTFLVGFVIGYVAVKL